MSGKVKRKYSHEDVLIAKSFKGPLNQISEILPKNYTSNDLLEIFKMLFPFQWQNLVERQQTYIEKDNHLQKIKKKKRYYAKSADSFFFSLEKVKNINSYTKKQQYAEGYNNNLAELKKEQLFNKREQANKKISDRVKEAKLNAQNVNPSYLSTYIKAYHKRGIATEEKLIIVKELVKFDTSETTRFFRKLNDSERNDMIRGMAFQHLQAYGHYVKLRKNFKGKKKSYQIEKANLKQKKPNDLYNLLKNNAIQINQEYDYFISHSSKDKSQVRECIKNLNKEGKICYCDWSMDDDFLKRIYTNGYTKEVLKVRMEQSKHLIFLRTENSMRSEWVEFELEYFENLKKQIFIINNVNDDFKKYKKFEFKKNKVGKEKI